MVPGTWDFQCQNQECARSTRLGWEMGIKELLASSTYFLCPEDRSLSSEGSLFPPLASLPSAVLMTPHLLPALLFAKGLVEEKIQGLAERRRGTHFWISDCSVPVHWG